MIFGDVIETKLDVEMSFVEYLDWISQKRAPIEELRMAQTADRLRTFQAVTFRYDDLQETEIPTGSVLCV